MKKKVKTNNPNTNVTKLVLIIVIVLVVGIGSVYGLKYLAHQRDLNSGMFNAIVDAVSPTVTAEVGEMNEDESGKYVNVMIKDNDGGSALYGLCISEYDTIDEALDNDPDCFDNYLLNSQIYSEVSLELPLDEVATIYYLYAKDNFGNISDNASVLIER